MDLSKSFEEAFLRAKQLPATPETQAKLYSLHRQATDGDAPEEDVPLDPLDESGRGWHEGWRKLRGMDKEEAKRQYIDYVSNLFGSGEQNR